MKLISTTLILMLLFGRLMCQPSDTLKYWIIKTKGYKFDQALHRKNTDFSKVKQLNHLSGKSSSKKGEVFRLGTKKKYSYNEMIELLGGNEVVASVEMDHIGYATGANETLPNDPLFNRQWYLFNDGSFSIFGLDSEEGADIKILQAWDITKGSEEIIIAVLDTGIDPDNPDFYGRLWNNDRETPGNGIDDDGNGFIDDIYGWDFVNEDAQPRDDGGHGNAISGLIGANTDNATGVAGVNQQSRLMICKVLSSDQSGFYSDWASGIRYAVDNGAHVINMSVAGDRDLKILSDAIQYAADRGVIIVASTGNDNTEQVFYPSGYESVIAVGSTDPDDTRSKAFNGSSSNGSNFGSHIDVVAPGNAIFALSLFGNDQSTIWGGTSMSCAVVTGLASLMMSANPDLSVNQLKGVLYQTSEDQVGLSNEDVPGWDKYYGFGRINAGAALEALQGELLTDPFELKLFPNPTTENINISILATSTTVTMVDVIDKTGHISISRDFQPLSPQLDVELNTSILPAGIYYLRVTQDDFSSSRRFVITR